MAEFSLLPLNSSGHQRCSAPCRRKSFPSSPCHVCLVDILYCLCGFSLLPLTPEVLYFGTPVHVTGSSAHTLTGGFLFNPCTSHFLFVLSKHRRAPSSNTYIYPFLQSPSAAGAKAQLYWWRQSAPNTHCWLYYLHQRPSYEHISRRKHVQHDCPALCQSLSASLHEMINYPTLHMDRPPFTLAFGLCVKIHTMLHFGSE